MLLWCTMEFGYLRLADGFVQSSSIMPQKRNPVALEHARAIGSKALGQASAITLAVHNTPYGDIVDTEDDLQPLVASMFRDALRAVALVAAAMRDASFDVARLESRAAEGGTTLTELADHLVREHGIPFRTAHGIAARLLKAHREQPDAPLTTALASISSDLLGVPLVHTDAQIAEIMSPRHFVEVRRTHGGPAPEETARALATSRDLLDRDENWLVQARDRLTAADARLRGRSQAL
jgi:argininosuccinate lyase